MLAIVTWLCFFVWLFFHVPRLFWELMATFLFTYPVFPPGKKRCMTPTNVEMTAEKMESLATSHAQTGNFGEAVVLLVLWKGSFLAWEGRYFYWSYLREASLLERGGIFTGHIGRKFPCLRGAYSYWEVSGLFYLFYWREVSVLKVRYF